MANFFSAVFTGSDNPVLNNPGSMQETCTPKAFMSRLCKKNHTKPLMMFSGGSFGKCLWHFLVKLFMGSQNRVHWKGASCSTLSVCRSEGQGGEVRAGLVTEQDRDLGRPTPSPVFPLSLLSLTWKHLGWGQVSFQYVGYFMVKLTDDWSGWTSLPPF